MTRNVQFQKRLMLFVGATSIAGCGWSCDPLKPTMPRRTAVQQPVAMILSL
ncbi:MAG: hypothetical protein ACJ0BJ_12470 [Pirellulales bacterium]